MCNKLYIKVVSILHSYIDMLTDYPSKQKFTAEKDLLASFLRGENFNFGLCELRGKQELVVWMLWFNNQLDPNCEIC